MLLTLDLPDAGVRLVGLEATAKLVLAGRADELPTRRMLAATARDLKPAADAIAARLARITGLTVDVAEGESQPGSGSAPGVVLPTFVVRVWSFVRFSTSVERSTVPAGVAGVASTAAIDFSVRRPVGSVRVHVFSCSAFCLVVSLA